MKRLFTLIVILLAPVSVFASCSMSGYNIIYINGILTSETQARTDLSALRDRFLAHGGDSSISFLPAYNPSHLAGVGDFIKSIEQAYKGGDDTPIDDFDLKTMLMQIHSEVATRKVLLVGYSHGTFYANAMYDYLTTHGVPKCAIAVYNIATPASFVAGRADGGAAG